MTYFIGIFAATILDDEGKTQVMSWKRNVAKRK